MFLFIGHLMFLILGVSETKNYSFIELQYPMQELFRLSNIEHQDLTIFVQNKNLELMHESKRFICRFS